MTNLEMLKGSAAFNYPIDAIAYEVALEKNGLVPSAEYATSNERALELSISDLALSLVFSVKKLMDDGYTVELQSISDLWKLRWYYRNKWGLPDDTPQDGPSNVIRNKSWLW